MYAVAQVRISKISDADTRIKKSHIIKKYADKTVELIPDYAPAWLLLGAWHSEVANVDPAKDLAAGIFSKGLPDGASNEKAEKYIKKAIELRPEKSIRFKYNLAKHYDRSGQNQKAIKILNEILNEKPDDEIEEWNFERAKEMHRELT